jgi:DNA-binding XRE family transcriptional regulator
MSPHDKAGQRRPARARRSDSDSGGRDRAETVKRIRGILSRTQAELAVALGVSEKAVQSYEQ